MKTGQQIANMIRTYRRRMKLSREAFAEMADISVSAIHDIEQQWRKEHMPSLRTAAKLAVGMGITLDEFVFEEVQHE